MSTFFKLAALGAVSFAAVATSAQAQSRYGDIVAYEGGAQNCAPSACAPATTTVEASRYGSVQTVQPAYNAAPVVVDCSVFGTPGCGQQVVAQPTTVYTQPVQQSYTQSYAQTYAAEPVNCPAGTTLQADGTCMQSGSSYSSGTTYSSTTTYSAPSAAMTADCPAGTTMQPDGTCLQGSGGMSMSTQTYTPTYSQPSTAMMVDCPAGTTKQADGTCAQTATTYGYDASPVYGADVYRPIRK